MIREYKPEDLAAVLAMRGDFKQSFEYPQLDHPLMLVKKVMVDEENRPRMAAFGRLHINALLFVDHCWKTPQERLEAIEILQAEMMKAAATPEAEAMKAAAAHGIDIATTQMEGRFAERMRKLGWIRGWGEIFYHEIKSNNAPNSV